MSTPATSSTRAAIRLLVAAFTLSLLGAAPAASASPAKSASAWQLVTRKHHASPGRATWVRINSRVRAARSAKPSKNGSGRAPTVAPGEKTSAYGIAAGGNLQNLDAAELGRELDVARTAGSGWIRIDINWEVIQAGGPSSYNWGPFDRVVRSANERGLRVLAGVVYTPAWARPGTPSGMYPPADLGTFVSFCAAAVARYASMGVHFWEIWNEPNRGFWKPAPDPARYTQMLRLAYSTIKRMDPEAFVVSAGLSPYGAYGQASAEGMNPLTFLERMYRAGAAGSFDALGWHPYEWGVGIKFHPSSAWSQLIKTSTSARSIMMDNGDGRKQIWGTEYGAPTGATMAESAQADLLRAAYDAWTRWDWAGPLFWYSARDAGTNAHDREHNFGLVRRDFSQKPSFAAFQSVTRRA